MNLFPVGRGHLLPATAQLADPQARCWSAVCFTSCSHGDVALAVRSGTNLRVYHLEVLRAVWPSLTLCEGQSANVWMWCITFAISSPFAYPEGVPRPRQYFCVLRRTEQNVAYWLPWWRQRKWLWTLRFPPWCRPSLCERLPSRHGAGCWVTEAGWRASR